MFLVSSRSVLTPCLGSIFFLEISGLLSMEFSGLPEGHITWVPMNIVTSALIHQSFRSLGIFKVTHLMRVPLQCSKHCVAHSIYIYNIAACDCSMPDALPHGFFVLVGWLLSTQCRHGVSALCCCGAVWRAGITGDKRCELPL